MIVRWSRRVWSAVFRPGSQRSPSDRGGGTGSWRRPLVAAAAVALLASGVVGTVLVIVSRADVDDATPATATPASGGDPTVATSMVPASEPTSSGAVDDTPGPLVDIEAAEAVFESVRLAGDDVALPGDLEVQCLGIRFPLDTLERLEPVLDADPELIRVAEPYPGAAAGRSWPHEL